MTLIPNPNQHPLTNTTCKPNNEIASATWRFISTTVLMRYGWIVESDRIDSEYWLLLLGISFRRKRNCSGEALINTNIFSRAGIKMSHIADRVVAATPCLCLDY
eukprot:CAMPEP_0196814626 /NCGR_PEP_ID=MMETSP1362-20130617/44555_1 /TAXON_ID=163516 /ORGANISM="Leptocylindrus danicus, Strain CCMP1856" /LENGTH=103 /DNA_ID=CAMNT_0042191307 /DNA_START=200 /DNA_END=511 /DNA_ORIENTATION=-